MDESTVALVTGATRGLGLVTVRRLAELGWTVFLGARDADRGAAAAADMAGLDVRPVPIDVTSDKSVAAAVAVLDKQVGRLDVLVNNAGVSGPRVEPLDTGPADMRDAYETNVFGPVRVTRAFLPLLRRSVRPGSSPRVVMVSSGMGSIARTSDAERVEGSFVALTYPSTKTALNMITTQYARALPDFRINAADPGYTATDFNDHRGFQTVQEGTDAIATLAQTPPDGPTGGFFDRYGPVPW
jgi:NAD(P)-dependent dehydrogenase (short-subunit alcohol dehydrogenase family)